MGENSGISWTDNTFNGWIGCTEVGPGCNRCYARELDRRHQWGVPRPARIAGNAPHWGTKAPRYRTGKDYWRRPMVWNAAAARAGVPIKVFCNSLSDVFDNEVDDAWRADLFKIWSETPWLRWQVVTKRVPNIRKMLPPDWGAFGYPNVGLIATTVNQEEFYRETRLLDIPARWHGFSMEPQLGPIIVPPEVITDRPKFDRLSGGKTQRGSVWAITGGESDQGGNATRSDGLPIPAEPAPWNPAWAEELIATSQAYDAEFYVYVKQTGARPVGIAHPSDGSGSDPTKWPEAIRCQQFPPELLN